MSLRRAPLEERIAARQLERGPLKSGKYFEHAPAAKIFFALIGVVIITHLVALVSLGFA